MGNDKAFAQSLPSSGRHGLAGANANTNAYHLVMNIKPENHYDADASYICDSCGEEIVIPLDPSAGSSQQYVEDCPVCCNPNVIHVEFNGDEARVWAEPEQDRF